MLASFVILVLLRRRLYTLPMEKLTPPPPRSARSCTTALWCTDWTFLDGSHGDREIPDNPTDDYRGQWPRAYFDDRVWFHGIVTEQYQRDRRSTLGMPPSYEILWKLINMGVGDMDANESRGTRPLGLSGIPPPWVIVFWSRLIWSVSGLVFRFLLFVKEAEHYYRTTPWSSASVPSKRGRLRRRIRSS
jgi:hypothetical protein